MKSGFVAILGRPNVGKSTLLNGLINHHVSIVTDKSQTTRNNIIGIYNDEETQIVFLDTPGIHKPMQQLGKEMNNMAYSAAHDVDVAILVVDASKPFGTGDTFVIDHLDIHNVPLIIVFNKIDLARLDKTEELKKIYRAYFEKATFIDAVAKEGFNIDEVIKTVRNMLYFKSGNYYYMMVPKARSLTGELTVAPITTPITSFFDRFSVNVEEILKYTYGYTNSLDLLTYYNFLDYDEVHNIYAFRFHSYQTVSNPLAVLHFDVIYNTNDRTWKVWCFEAPNIIFPYRQEATRPGTLATTSLVNFTDIGEGSITGRSRIIQLYNWDNMIVRSCYIPHNCELTYNPDNATARIVDLVMHVSDEYAHVSGETLVFKHDGLAWVDGETLFVQDDSDFYVGYSKVEILQNIRKVYLSQDEYYTFKNYQFIDTGYKKDALHTKKRYREIQFQINNLDQKNLNFGMDYILDGSPRRVMYKYEVSQMIDELDPEYGIVYIDSDPLDFGPFPHTDFDIDDIDLTNQWSIDQNLIPEVSLWKVRVAVSGKGYAPRLRLYSRNEKRFELMNINWISKIMHMR